MGPPISIDGNPGPQQPAVDPVVASMGPPISIDGNFAPEQRPAPAPEASMGPPISIDGNRRRRCRAARPRPASMGPPISIDGNARRESHRDFGYFAGGLRAGGTPVVECRVRLGWWGGIARLYAELALASGSG